MRYTGSDFKGARCGDVPCEVALQVQGVYSLMPYKALVPQSVADKEYIADSVLSGFYCVCNCRLLTICLRPGML